MSCSLHKFSIIIAFRSEYGSHYLLPVVKRAENMVVNDTLNHDYLSPTGIEGFTKSACRLLLGDIEKLWNDGKVKYYYLLIKT